MCLGVCMCACERVCMYVFIELHKTTLFDPVNLLIVILCLPPWSLLRENR